MADVVAAVMIRFEMKSETKNGFTFVELPEDSARRARSDLYLLKVTLSELEWEPGQDLVVEVRPV